MGRKVLLILVDGMRPDAIPACGSLWKDGFSVPDKPHRVSRVVVGPDLFGKIGSQHGAADCYKAPRCALMYEAYRFFHCADGCSHKRGKADETRIFPKCRSNDCLWRDVTTEVYYLESVVLK